MGKDAERKARVVKNHIRKALGDPNTEWGRVVANLAHVPDTKDYLPTFQVLFGRKEDEKS